METKEEAAKPADRLADDLLDGGPAIAEFLGCNTREVYHLHKTGRLPIGRLGRKLIASKRHLARHANKLTRGPTAA
jgi:hypothetical protein